MWSPGQDQTASGKLALTPSAPMTLPRSEPPIRTEQVACSGSQQAGFCLCFTSLGDLELRRKMSRDVASQTLAGGSRDRLTSKQPASPASCTPTRPKAPRPSSTELWEGCHVSHSTPASAWARGSTVHHQTLRWGQGRTELLPCSSCSLGLGPASGGLPLLAEPSAAASLTS